MDNLNEQEIRDRISRGNDLSFVTDELVQEDALTVQSTTARGLLHYAQVFEIRTLDDSKMASNELISISTCKKAMETLRTAELKPHKDAQDTIRATYTNLMAPVLEAEQIMKAKQLTYLQEQARLKAKAEEVNRLALELAQEEMENTGELSQSVVEVPVTEAPKRVHGALGTTGMVDSWKYEVVDFAALPDEYKVVDSTMLNAIAKRHHDTKQVPGVKFFNQPYLASRGH